MPTTWRLYRNISSRKPLLCRLVHTKHTSVDAIVVGGGPSGIATVGNILEQQPRMRLLWVDPVFQSGRIGARYREVPSNTKVKLFLQFATAVQPFRHVIESVASKDNPVTELQNLPQDQGCSLHHAADLCSFLTSRLAEEYTPNIQQHFGTLTAANLNAQTNLWVAGLDGKEQVVTPRLFLTTGSHPITSQFPAAAELSIQSIHLDTALKPSQLAKTLDPKADLKVAVTGASHSAILVLMNLYNLATGTHPKLRIKWFSRHKNLRYAKEMDGWILYDNTGLKGQAASWAFEHLEDPKFNKSPVNKYIQRCIALPADEHEKYKVELPGCTHLVQAIGYKRNPLPPLTESKDQPQSIAKLLNIEHDSRSGRFYRSSGSSDEALKAPNRRIHIPGLFGAGIAFPEQVTDPAGNTEYAVGLWKFMKFLKRVTPEWVGSA